MSSKSNAQRDWTLSANSDNNYTQKNGNVNRYSKELFPDVRTMTAENIELDYVEHLLENPNNYSIK